MSKEQKVGLFFLFGVFLAAVAVEVTVGTGLFTKRYPLYADYHDVEGLKVGDPVRIAGVQMGRVDQIAVTSEYVRVRMQINTARQVRRNSVARLDFQALSGSRFIAISLGSPDQPVLKPGDTVQSEQGMSISDMLGQFNGVGKSITDLADSFNRNQDELLRSLNSLIAENQDSIRGILAALDSITNKLNQGQGTLAKLINDPGLYNQVDRLLHDADTVMRDLQHVTTRLAQGKGSLGRLVAEDDLYDDLQETLASLNNTARNLEALSDGVRDGQGTLGRLVTDDSLYLEAQQAVRGLDRAATGIEDQAPISVLATFVSTLF
jgi:phospholipid/cholesterol/gamma-HCH transport system substrate-binding protein